MISLCMRGVKVCTAMTLVMQRANVLHFYRGQSSACVFHFIFLQREVGRMSKTTLISEMLKFQFGNKIVCTDGEDGTLSHVIFDPATCRMQYIGAKLGRFFGKTVHLPFGAVVDATGEGVTVSVKRAELAASNPEVSGAYLDHKSVVERAGSSTRGTLRLVAVQPGNGELAYIVA